MLLGWFGVRTFKFPQRGLGVIFVMDLQGRKPPVSIKLIVLLLTGVSRSKFVLDCLPPPFFSQKKKSYDWLPRAPRKQRLRHRSRVNLTLTDILLSSGPLKPERDWLMAEEEPLM